MRKYTRYLIFGLSTIVCLSLHGKASDGCYIVLHSDSFIKEWKQKNTFFFEGGVIHWEKISIKKVDKKPEVDYLMYTNMQEFEGFWDKNDALLKTTRKGFLFSPSKKSV